MARGGSFIYEAETKELRWVTHDRATGATVARSEPLESFTAGAGEPFSLIPSEKRPWFEFVDGGGDCLYGHLHNYPSENPAKLFKTDRIMSVTPRGRDEIPTLLALAKEPYKRPASPVTMADIMEEITLRAHDGPRADPTPTAQKPGGKRHKPKGRNL